MKQVVKLTRGEKVAAFVTRYALVPEGKHVGKPLVLLPFQLRFIKEVYDNPAGTSRAYLSVSRKNGKSALIACMVLAHLVGPEARLNTQIISGARSRDQAALVFKLAEKMVRLSPELSKIVKIVPSQKQLIGLPMNVEYRAISAEAGTAHGLSPVLAILDEVGQIKGPSDAFVEAIETAQGAHESPLLVAISTQAASDHDLFSEWLDKAVGVPTVVSHLYTAPDGCELDDRAAWAAANPALGVFRALKDVEDFAEQAKLLPAKENSFRWLFLNQRIEASAPFISRKVWADCAGAVADRFDGPVFAGLDLSEVADLTAFVAVSPVDGVWQVRPTFWLPGQGLAAKAKADRVPYDLWHKQGFLEATPGPTVDYEFVADWIWRFAQGCDLRKIGFDRFNMRHLKPWLQRVGFSEEQTEKDGMFEDFGQGFVSMSPALRAVESALLTKSMAHGGHPVLTMCAANAVVTMDPAGNRKLVKSKSSGRIDGMVALAMAMSVAGTWQETTHGASYLENDELMVL